MSKLGGGPGGPLSIASMPPIVISGLYNAMLVTTLNVVDVAAPIPSSALADRNSITITNLSATDTIYISSSPLVTADRVVGTTSGHEIGPLESFNINITDAIILYAISESGKTILTKVMEVA